jgi:hypothetical protein
VKERLPHVIKKPKCKEAALRTGNLEKGTAAAAIVNREIWANDYERRRKYIVDAIGVPVVCVETGETFDTVIAAVRSMPGNLNIRRALRDPWRTAGGYHWRYA